MRSLRAKKRKAAPATKQGRKTVPKGTAKTAPARTCRTVKVKGRRKPVRKCAPVKRKLAARKPPAIAPPVFTPDAPPVALPAELAPAVPAVAYEPAPVPFPSQVELPPPTGGAIVVPPPPDPVPPGTLPVHRTFGPREAERLLWRAGFGPKPGDVDRLVSLGLEGAVRSLTRPSGAATLVGPEPRTQNGDPLAPLDVWGHDALWWLDRMVRSDQPLVERMTLVWHDWFATSIAKAQRNHVLDQNAMLRRNSLGSFRTLLREVTIDPAMLDFLDGVRNTRWSLNENYAREVMELFSLGAGRGAYTETDIRETAKALTGWRADWAEGTGFNNFRFDWTWRVRGPKTIFGTTADFGWEDVVNLCVDHPLHASFFVAKLWSYFVPEPPPPATAAALEALYVSGGHQVRPVLEAILKHPALYGEPAMVKPPVVYLAGLLRLANRAIQTDAWAWLLPMAGQHLFEPPNVAGWDDSAWLDTSTWRGRWEIAAHVLWMFPGDPWSGAYPADETPEQGLAAALARFSNPALPADTRQELLRYARECLPSTMRSWEQSPFRAYRQNALRMLVMTCSDLQTC